MDHKGFGSELRVQFCSWSTSEIQQLLLIRSIRPEPGVNPCAECWCGLGSASSLLVLSGDCYRDREGAQLLITVVNVGLLPSVVEQRRLSHVCASSELWLAQTAPTQHTFHTRWRQLMRLRPLPLCFGFLGAEMNAKSRRCLQSSCFFALMNKIC